MVCMLMATGAGAQSANCKWTLTLTVKDDHTAEPLEAAIIMVEGIAQPALTDANGKATLSGLCTQTYTLTVSHAGCQSQTLQLELKGNTSRQVYLHHVKTELGEVEVVGYRANQAKLATDLKGTQLFATRGLSIAQALTAVNGVRMLATGGTIAKPVVNGLHSNRLVLITNEVKLESQQWGTDHAPELDPYAADKFIVVKGAASVRYGPEAIGGVVLATPAPLMRLAGLEGEVQAAAFSNNAMGALSAMLQGAMGKEAAWAWRLQGSVKKGANLRVPGYYLRNTAMDEGNWMAMGSYRHRKWELEGQVNFFNTRIGLYTGAHVDNLDDLQAAINSTKPLFVSNLSYRIGRPYQQAQHWLGKLKATYQWNHKHQTTLWVAHQENIRQEYDSRAFIELPELNLNMGTTSSELLHEVQVAEGMHWQTGMHLSYQQNVNSPSSARIFIRNFEAGTASAFSIFKMARGKWAHEAGLRYDYRHFQSFYRNNNALIQHTRTFSNATATLGSTYYPAPHWTINMQVATAWRPPAPNELYANGLHQGLAAVEIGNQDFAAERSLHTGVQVVYKKPNQLHAELALYNNRIADFIYLQPVQPPALTINGYYPRFEYRQTEANVTGVDLLVKYFLATPLEAYARVNLLYARNLSANDWLILMPADRLETGLTWYPTSGKKWLNPYLKLGLIHTVHQKRVPNSSRSGAEADYAPPPAAYTLLEAEAGTLLAKSGIQAGISVYNLTNATYRDYLNRFRYFAAEQGTNIAVRIKVPIQFKKHNI